ncbi:aprataxin and PNK-like factor isoform X5 [Falco rusticolus]|nr:aprataxin and PNK-like factor isoform X5 [Falco rusticolus]
MVPVCPRSHLEILLLILRQCEILFLWQSEAFSKSKETAVTTRRKNPIHFQQFSHPNDDDNHETEIVTQDNNDNRPECPYGTACYRKNPQHKLEYKHSAPPGLLGLKCRRRVMPFSWGSVPCEL